jgi:glycosyltransferase involved in cell wall biosynthesis
MDQKGNFSPKIRIAYLMHGMFYGGASRSLFLLLKSMKDFCQYERIIYTISVNSTEIEKDFLKYASEIKLAKLKTISVNQVHRDSVLKYLVNSRISCKKFVKCLVDDNIDILHINTSVFPQVPEYVKKFSKIKVITHIREYIDPQDKSAIHDYMVNKIISFSDVLIAISENEIKSFHSHPDIIILSNPFEFKNIEQVQSDFRKINGINSGTVLVTMVSHFSRQKGHLNFLMALNQLLITNPYNIKFKFVIVGFQDKRRWWKLAIKRLLLRPDYTNEVMTLIKDLRLKDHILVIPYTNDVFSILSASDIVVRPADSGDPWGRDIIEAMAFSKPVIATGNSEVFVKSGISGFLVKPQDPVELAMKIRILIASKELREKFGNEGHRIIRNMCDMKTFGMEINSIYKKLVKAS